MELIINTPFTTVISGAPATTPSDAVLYLAGAPSGVSLSTTLINGATNVWLITFTPTVTGNYSLFAFGIVQLRIQCVAKSSTLMLTNMEDEALGSWTWDKATGVLTILRQNGTTLATHDVTDTLVSASRERVS